MGTFARRVCARLRSASAAYAVFERDFLVFTSQRRFLLTRTLAVFFPALVVGIILLNSLGIDPDRIGWEVFGGAFVTVPLLVLLLAPAVAAPAIAAERQLRTLDIVLVAPVGPWSFVLAKFLSRLGTLLVLILGTLPVSALCLVYGGISASLYLDAVALCVAFAVSGTALGIFASAWCRGVAPAVLLAYGLAVLVPGVYTISIALVGLRNVAATGGPNLIVAAFSSFATWSAVLAGGISGNSVFGGPGLAHLGAACAVALPALLLAGARLRSEAAWTSRAPRGGRRRRTLATGRPVLDRGLRGSLLSRPGWRAYGLLAAVLAVTGLALWIGIEASDLDEAWPHLMALEFVGGIVCFAVLARSAAEIAGERQQGSLALLMTTPLGAPRIVAWKLGATLLSALPLLIVPLLHAAVAVPASDLKASTVLTWIVTTGVTLFLFAALGLRVSIAVRSAGRAVLAVFGVVLGGMVAHGVLLFVLALISRGSDEVGAFASAASPAVVVVALPVIVSEGLWQKADLRFLFASCVFWLVVHAAVATILAVSSVRALRNSGE